MNCTVCTQPVGPGAAPFHCAICARTALYTTRIALARTLLTNETYAPHIEAIIAPSAATAGKALALPSGTLLDVNESSKKAARERAIEAARELRERANLAEAAAATLREQVKEVKGVIERGKDDLEERRRVIGTAREKLKERKAKLVESREKLTARMEKSVALVHARTAQGRIDLCREAADLAGLRVRRRRGKDGGWKDECVVGYNPAPDLRELNSMTANQISASLSNTTRLLLLVANYLQVRLPAEVTLPQKNYPHPTIFHPSASYLPRKAAFQSASPSGSKFNFGHNNNTTNDTSNKNNSTNTHTDATPPTATGTHEATPPVPFSTRAGVERKLRPRPLHTDRRLAGLAREEAGTYALFVEGVTLLAWDVAWLCHVQGMTASFGTWEDLCPIGLNLHELLVVRLRSLYFSAAAGGRVDEKGLGGGDAAAAAAASASKATTTTVAIAGGGAGVGSAARGDPTSFGHFSHATTHYFLGAAEGQARVRAWRWQSQFKLLLDRVKTTLAAEMQGAEWEMLESREWFEAPGKVDEEPVVVGRRARETSRGAAGTGGAGTNRGDRASAQKERQREREDGGRRRDRGEAIGNDNDNDDDVGYDGTERATRRERIPAVSNAAGLGIESGAGAATFAVSVDGRKDVSGPKAASGESYYITPAARKKLPSRTGSSDKVPAGQGQGINGWTKLKSRSGETK